MNLFSSRIETLVFVSALLSCVSCTAGATKDTPEDKSVCLEIGQLLDPLRIFLNDEIANLLAHSPDQIANGVTPELLGDLTSLIACSTRLTELELKDKNAVNRERCDPFPFSVTLSGLEESLKEVVECRTQSCTLDKIFLKKEVMQHQKDRLKMLAKKCSES
jgi:hypothetical protein